MLGLPKYPFDFEVEYKFYSREEGGRETGPPFQGYRCDFAYAEDKIEINGRCYMIWPFFYDEKDEIIGERLRVPNAGKAAMFILDPAMRPYHRGRIKVGTEAFLVEGRKKVAKIKVTKILALFDNLISYSR